jgi:hypothetical protein
MSHEDGPHEDAVEFMQVPSASVLDINLNEIIRIDGNGIYFLVRERPSVLWKSDVAVLKNVPPEGVTSVTILRESRGDRLKSAFGGWLALIGLIALLGFILHPGAPLTDVVLLPAVALATAFQLFRGFMHVDTILIFLADGKRHEVRLRPKQWHADGPRIMRIIDGWGRPIRT